MEVEYKKLDETNLDQYIELYEAFLKETNNENTKVDWRTIIYNNIFNEKALFLCAMLGDEMIGIRSLVPVMGLDGVPALETNGLYVKPEHRHKGLALSLLNVSKAWAKLNEYKTIYMTQPAATGKWLRRTHFGFVPEVVILKMEV